MRSLIARIWRRFFYDIGLQQLPPPQRTFELDERVRLSLQDLAEREQRSQEEVAADLLSIALAQRQNAEMYLQRWRNLSRREQQICALVCLDYSNVEIGEKLFISPETVKTHIQNVLRKFGLRRKYELRQILSEWDFSGWEDIVDP